MDYYITYALRSYLNEIIHRYRCEAHRAEQLKGYEKKRLKIKKSAKGTPYYSVFDNSERCFKYLGKENNREVQLVKEAHYLAASTKGLRNEINLINNVLANTGDMSYEAINDRLSNVYKGACISHKAPSAAAVEWKRTMEARKKTYRPYKPEELIHETNDGTMVRSKEEALIYNLLLLLGITFVYELPLKIKYEGKHTLILPDFTVLCEIDYCSVIYIEHQGMMSDYNYREKFKNCVYKYWSNGYMPERDVFFTFNLPNGGFNDTPVRNVIRNYVRPEGGIARRTLS